MAICAICQRRRWPGRAGPHMAAVAVRSTTVAHNDDEVAGVAVCGLHRRVDNVSVDNHRYTQQSTHRGTDFSGERTCTGNHCSTFIVTFSYIKRRCEILTGSP